MEVKEKQVKTDNELIAEFMGMHYQIAIGPFGGEYPYVQDGKTKEWIV